MSDTPTCAALGCDHPTHENAPMCQVHWNLIPRTLRLRYHRSQPGAERRAIIAKTIETVLSKQPDSIDHWRPQS